MTTKELLEIIILIIGGGGATATAGFAFAVYQERQNLERLKLELKGGLLEFGRKVQKNIDSNGVEIGIIKSEFNDMKAQLQKQKVYQPPTHSIFPPENKPKHTGWNIEDA